MKKFRKWFTRHQLEHHGLLQPTPLMLRGYYLEYLIENEQASLKGIEHNLSNLDSWLVDRIKELDKEV